MPHMKPQVEQGDWWEVDLPDGGVEWVPYDAGDTRRLNSVNASLYKGWWGARLSAPGYMDCTDWCAFKHKSDARKYLRETYDVCPDCGVDVSERECPDGHAWDMPAARADDVPGFGGKPAFNSQARRVAERVTTCMVCGASTDPCDCIRHL